MFHSYRSMAFRSKKAGKVYFESNLKDKIMGRLKNDPNEYEFMPILMPVCGRPEYLRQVLEALQNAKSIEKVSIVSTTEFQ